MAEDFKLLLGAQFDNASVKKALDAIPQSARTVQVEVKGNNTFLKSTTEEGNKLTTTLTRVNTKTGETTQMFERTKYSADKMSTSIATASKHTDTLGDKFISVTKKVLAFGAVTSIISGFTKVMYEAVQVVQEFDKATTEFTKVSNVSGEELSDYTAKLGELGEQVARTTTEMVEASTEFVKSGYTEEQSAQLAKIASLYQNIADSEIDAGSSASYIISQMKAFNITATDAISIIDKTNQIANKFAVSSTDISTALTKSSSALATYGNTIDQSISLVTAG